MWRVGAAASILLLIVLATQVWPHHSAEAKPLSASTIRACAKQVLHHWVVDGRILDGYRRECYKAALDRVSGGDVSCDPLYGVGLLCDDLEARLRTSG